MLAAPSAIAVQPDGSLKVIDRDGREVIVPVQRLPFLAGGGRSDGISQRSMTALQGATNGVLDGAPAYVLYFSAEWGKIQILRVQSSD